MKKLTSLLLALLVALLVPVANAETLRAGDIEIEYTSPDELQAIFSAVKEQLVADYQTVLFDATTYDGATYIIGETFPAGRYYIYPVVVSETNTTLYVELCVWSKNDVNDTYPTDYIYASQHKTVELTDGMKIGFSWDAHERGVCLAMQRLPDNPSNLMDIFG